MCARERFEKTSNGLFLKMLRPVSSPRPGLASSLPRQPACGTVVCRHCRALSLSLSLSQTHTRARERLRGLAEMCRLGGRKQGSDRVCTSNKAATFHRQHKAGRNYGAIPQTHLCWGTDKDAVFRRTVVQVRSRSKGPFAQGSFEIFSNIWHELLLIIFMFVLICMLKQINYMSTEEKSLL